MEEVTRAVMSVEDVGKKLSISRANAYALCHSKGFPTIRIGRRLLVPNAAFEEWLRRQTEMCLEH